MTANGEFGPARSKARDAFARGDYARFIELLEPLNGELSATELRQLEFAKARTKQ